MVVTIQECYNLLGVGYGSTMEEIQKAYRVKCKTLHPDVNDSPDATEMMQLVNEAYAELYRRYGRGTYVPEEEPETEEEEKDDSADSFDYEGYADANWYHFSTPDKRYPGMDEENVPWWVIGMAACALAQLLNSIL